MGQPTEEEAAVYWRRAASSIAADQPYTWLFDIDAVHAVRDRLRGTRVDALGLFQVTWLWWMEE